MKKSLLLLTLTLLATSLALTSNAFSISPVIIESLTPSTSTAPANNSSTITITASSQRYACSVKYNNPPGTPSPYDQPQTIYAQSDTSECDSYKSYWPGATTQDLSPAVLVPGVGWPFDIEVSGSGNTLSTSSITTNSSGTATFTLKSSVAETKTIYLIENGKGGGGSVEGSVASTTVTFTNPTSSSSSHSSSSSAGSTTTPAAPTTPPPPAAPTATSLMQGSTKLNSSDSTSTTPIDIASTKPISISPSNPLVLSGTTVPNGVVTLTIHSTPKTVTVTADKTGKWSYAIVGLPAGNHYVEATVTDPTTKQTSAAVKLAAFTVKAAPVSTTITKAPKHFHLLTFVLALALFLLVGLSLWYYWMKRNKKKAASSPSTADAGITGGRMSAVKQLNNKPVAISIILAISLVGAFVLTKSFAAGPTYTLVVNLPADTGDSYAAAGGTVVSNPAGINCSGDGSVCSASFAAGTQVTLTDTDNSGYRIESFDLNKTNYYDAGGTASCANGASTSPCVFTINNDTTLNMYWEYTSVNIDITKTGSGSGTVTASLGGINCGNTCSASLATQSGIQTTPISLVATPGTNSTFAGWQLGTDDLCANWAGKGSGTPAGPNPDPSCQMTFDGVHWKDYVIIPEFDLKPGASSSSSGGSTPSTKPTTTTTTPTTSTTPTISPTTPTTAAAAIAASASGAVQLKTVAVAGKDVDTTKPVEYLSNQDLTLSGTTTPSGTVTFTIHSTPKTVTTKADSTGKWSYTVIGLAAGTHYLQASVTDPTTKQASATATLISFTIKAAPKTTVATTAPAKKSSNTGTVILLLILLVVLGAAGWYGWKWWDAKKKGSGKKPMPPTEISPTVKSTK